MAGARLCVCGGWLPLLKAPARLAKQRKNLEDRWRAPSESGPVTQNSLSHIGGAYGTPPRGLFLLCPEARGCLLRVAVPRSKVEGLQKGNRWRRGGSCCQAARKRTKRKGVPFGYAPLGLPPSVVPKGRTSDAPLSALMNNTVEFRTQDVPLLRSTTLNLYHNVEVNWLIYQRLSEGEIEAPTPRGGLGS